MIWCNSIISLISEKAKKDSLWLGAVPGTCKGELASFIYNVRSPKPTAQGFCQASFDDIHFLISGDDIHLVLNVIDLIGQNNKLILTKLLWMGMRYKDVQISNTRSLDSNDQNAWKIINMLSRASDADNTTSVADGIRHSVTSSN